MKSYKFITLALGAVVLTGCADLDTVPQSAYVTTDQKEETLKANPERALAGVTGISSGFSRYCAYSDDHNDYGYPSTMLFLDSRGTDMVGFNIGYNWYSSSGAMSDYQSDASCPGFAWRGIYNQISSCNALIPTIDPETDNEELQFYLAQGLAFRSFDYWVLAQMFQFNYSVAADEPCVPIITEANADEAAINGCERASVEETYKQIIDDITAAIDLLSKTSVKASNVIASKPKRLINLDAAYALRARYYLSMHKYSEAAADAQKCLDITTAHPYSFDEVSVPTFASIDDSSWLWGIAIAETDRVVTSAIINWPSHMGSFNYGYASVGAWRKIAKNLYNTIPDSDVRKGWFLDENGVSKNLPADYQDYITNEAGAPAYTQVKFAPYKGEFYTSTSANDIMLMRVEEVILTLAEAQAMSGDLPAGKATLEQFVQTYRNPNFSSRAASMEDFQNECWYQRRLEFWGEGISWYDIMRLNKGLDRRGGGWPAPWVYNVPAGEQIMVFQIPMAEQQSNKLCKPNPGGIQPQAVADN